MTRSRAFGFLLAVACLALPMAGSWATPAGELFKQAESVRSSDPAQFQQVLQQLEAAQAEFSPAQRDQLRYLKAYAEGYSGRYDIAIREARELIESTQDVDLKFRAGALIVNSYALTRQFTDGFRQLEATMPLAGQVKNPDVRQHGLIAAAVIHNQVGQYRVGLGYAESVLAEQAPERTLCFAGQLKLEALQGLAALPATDDPILQAVGQCRKVGETILANFLRITLARKWAAQGSRRQAIDLLQQHLAEVEATRYPRLIGEVESLLAELALAESELAGAEAHANAAIAQSAGIAYSLPLVAAYRVRYEIAERRGDAVAALAHYKRYAEVDKAYLNDIKARELAYQIVRQEMQQKNQQIDLLDRQNQVLQLQGKVAQQATQNTRLVVALMALLLLSIGFWAYKTKRVQMSLRHMAQTDALTGSFNRHHFTTTANAVLKDAARDGREVSMIMFDLDHFKEINDRYGHEAGDWTLKRVAEACRGHFRAVDALARIGGEEFAIILDGIDLSAATRLAEDCRVCIAAVCTRDTGYTFPVSASFGVTSSAASGYDLTRLLSHADQALYRAKHDGRNCVRAHVPEAMYPMHGPEAMSVAS